jgi:hypothetical protein
VSIVIEVLPPGAAKINLAEEAIRTDVELRLRMAGMNVTPLEQLPAVYVNVNVLDDAQAMAILVELKQRTSLPRTASTVVATTWSSGSLGSNLSADHSVSDQRQGR